MPGAPKKAARPVIAESTKRRISATRLNSGAGSPCCNKLDFKLTKSFQERDLAAMTEEEQIAYAMQVCVTGVRCWGDQF